jgi:hypothetical protein
MAKHIPIRQCVACRTARPKRELLRVVIDANGAISLDPTGKKAAGVPMSAGAASAWSRPSVATSWTAA